MHDDRGEGLGADVGAFYEAVREEERRHQRADAADERRQEAESRANQGERAHPGPPRRAAPHAAPRHQAEEEGADHPLENAERRGREQGSARERERRRAEREPFNDPEIEFAPVEPHPAPVPDELSDGEDRDRLPDAERRRERREQHGSPAEPRHGGERAGEERGAAENQPLADHVHVCET